MQKLIFGIFLTFLVCSSAEEISIAVDQLTLKGEFESVPNKTARAVIIIPGSGPTDRDGNTIGYPGKNNSLRYLAEYLKKEGVPSLRIDKRGIGASSKVKEAELRFTDYVNDVQKWVDFLNKKGYSEVVLLGHSEGALVATLAAKHKSVVALICLAGAGMPAPDVLRKQLKKNLPANLYKKADTVIESLAKGEKTEDYPKSLAMLFRPSVQPYLISWFKVDPAGEIKKLNIPILIIQGTSDLQVTMEDAKLLDENAKNSKLVSIKDMNHVLKHVTGNLQQQMSSYFDPDLRLHSEVGKSMIQFVKNAK